MLEKSQIEKIRANFQTTLGNVVREYAQHLFLSRFYKKKGSGNILFKGGTALRFAYKSPRFSEDLDFSVKDYLNQNEVEKAVLDVLVDFTNSGIACEVEESKQTTGGYLANLFLNIYGIKTSIAIQISSRVKAGIDSQNLPITNEYIPTYSAILLSKDEVAKEKIQAALSRSKPRDFFDVYFLLREGLIPIKQRKRLDDIRKIIGSGRVDFAKELDIFLPKSMSQLAKSFPHPLLTEIDRFI